MPYNDSLIADYASHRAGHSPQTFASRHPRGTVTILPSPSLALPVQSPQLWDDALIWNDTRIRVDA